MQKKSQASPRKSVVSTTQDSTAGMPPSDNAIGVLGCTGSVGQRFMLLLIEHPYFSLHAIGASSRSVGKKYGDVAPWKQTKALPEEYEGLVVRPCEPQEFKECDIVFSGLDSSVAGEIELAFLKANLAVFSNAKNYRQDPLVPLIVPTVNLDRTSSRTPLSLFPASLKGLNHVLGVHTL